MLVEWMKYKYFKVAFRVLQMASFPDFLMAWTHIVSSPDPPEVDLVISP